MNKLSQHPKRNPYQAPEGYFQQLPLRLQQRLAGSGGKDLLPWYLKRRWQTAFMLVLVIGIGLWLTLPTKQQDPQAASLIAALPEEAIVNYFQEDVLASVSMADLSSDVALLTADDFLQSVDEESLYLELEDDAPSLNQDDLSL